MSRNKEALFRWLKVLFFIYVADTLLSVLALAATILPISVGSWYTWAQRAVNLGVAVCLYLLPGKYRYAGMLKALALLCTLISMGLYPLLNAYGIQMQGATYMETIKWLSRCTVALNLLAFIFEFTTHAKNAGRDKVKWYILLGCSLAVTLVSHAAAYFGQPILDALDMEDYIRITKVWNVAARTLSLLISAAYLVLLNRLVRTTGQKKYQELDISQEDTDNFNEV